MFDGLSVVFGRASGSAASLSVPRIAADERRRGSHSPEWQGRRQTADGSWLGRHGRGHSGEALILPCDFVVSVQRSRRFERGFARPQLAVLSFYCIWYKVALRDVVDLNSRWVSKVEKGEAWHPKTLRKRLPAKVMENVFLSGCYLTLYNH